MAPSSLGPCVPTHRSCSTGEFSKEGLTVVGHLEFLLAGHLKEGLTAVGHLKEGLAVVGHLKEGLAVGPVN